MIIYHKISAHLPTQKIGFGVHGWSVRILWTSSTHHYFQKGAQRGPSEGSNSSYVVVRSVSDATIL